MLDTDTLIFMIRGLKSSNGQSASRDRAQRLVDRCRQAQARGDTLAVSAHHGRGVGIRSKTE